MNEDRDKEVFLTESERNMLIQSHSAEKQRLWEQTERLKMQYEQSRRALDFISNRLSSFERGAHLFIVVSQSEDQTEVPS